MKIKHSLKSKIIKCTASVLAAFTFITNISYYNVGKVSAVSDVYYEMRNSGRYSSQIVEYQKWLCALGYPVAIDGYKGAETTAAIKKYQKNKGLTITGNVDAVTYRTMYDDYKNISSANAVTPTEITGILDFDKMNEYAKTYWHNYNPNYQSFKSANADCANFVSQILVAGGLDSSIHSNVVKYLIGNLSNDSFYSRYGMRVEYYNNSSYYPDNDPAPRTRSSFTISDIEPGDLITSGNGAYGKAHIMFVIGKSGNTVHFSGHTNDAYYGLSSYSEAGCSSGAISIGYVTGVVKTSALLKTTHTHTFDESHWLWNETYHYYPATCGCNLWKAGVHTLGPQTTVSAATCTSPAVYRQSCTMPGCGYYVERQGTSTLRHNYEASTYSDGRPMYDQDQYYHWTVGICKTCHKTGEATAKTKHTFTDWKEQTARVKVHSCTVCGYTETKIDKDPAANILWGDVNGNGEVQLTDYVQLNLYIKGEKDTLDNFPAADVDQNGIIDDRDLEYIRQASVSLISLPIPIVWGDANDDGVLSNSDVVSINKYLTEKNTGRNSTEVKNVIAADVDCDGMITSDDADYIKKAIVGLITLPVQLHGNKTVVLTAVSKTSRLSEYSKQVIDVYYGYSDEETAITMAGYHDAYNQKFEMIPYGEGYYIMKASYCDMVWDINGSNPRTSQYGKLQIFRRKDAENQLFKPIKNSDDTYSFVSKDGRILTVNTEDGSIFAERYYGTNWIRNENKFIMEVVNDSTSPVTTEKSLDLDAMYNYAQKWHGITGTMDSSGYNNDEYPNYTNNDCANFTSQILVAGGVPETSEWHGSYSYGGEASFDFKTVTGMINYFKNEYGICYYNDQGYSLADYTSFSISDIQPGDMITSRGNGDDPYGVGHIMYVLSVSNGTVYIAGHTYNRWNHPMSKSFITGVLKTSQIKLNQ